MKKAQTISVKDQNIFLLFFSLLACHQQFRFMPYAQRVTIVFKQKLIGMQMSDLAKKYSELTNRKLNNRITELLLFVVSVILGIGGCVIYESRMAICYVLPIARSKRFIM